jgi:hypothetical protein
MQWKESTRRCAQQAVLPLNVVYEWLTTVDHKKIGLMYIGMRSSFW